MFFLLIMSFYTVFINCKHDFVKSTSLFIFNEPNPKSHNSTGFNTLITDGATAKSICNQLKVIFS